MTDQTAQMLIQNLPAILTAGGVVISAMGAILSVVMQYKSRRDLAELAVNTNSIKDALVAVTKESSFAAGQKKATDDAAKTKAIADAAFAQGVVAAVPVSIIPPIANPGSPAAVAAIGAAQLAQGLRAQVEREDPKKDKSV